MRLKYVDMRPIRIPYIVPLKRGVSLPNGDNIIDVTEVEAQGLLKIKNGDRPCFEVVIEEKT